MREIPQLQRKPGIALVLSGGATKAFYFHLGVLKVLQPENITSVVGTSAGAVIGAFVASGATVDNLMAALQQRKVYLPKFDTWVRSLTSTMLFKPKYQDIAWQAILTGYSGLRFLASLPVLGNRDLVAEALDRLIESQTHVTGFFDAIALEDLFKSLLPYNDFSHTDMDLYVVATCLDCRMRAVFNGLYEFADSENWFMTNVPIHKAVRASTCIPGMFEPVKINGKYFVDGEIKQTLSVDVGVQLADKVIVSHTYQPLYRGEQFSVRDMGWLNIVKQSSAVILSERIAVWRNIYQQQNPDKEIVWIQPDPEDAEFFGAPEFSFNPDLQKRLIRSGEIAAFKALNKTLA